MPYDFSYEWGWVEMCFWDHAFGDPPEVCWWYWFHYLRNIHGGCSKMLSANSKNTFINLNQSAQTFQLPKSSTVKPL